MAKEDSKKLQGKKGEESKPSGDAPKTQTRKRRKDMPSVSYLLAHGDPETAHLPKTWKDIAGPPISLAVVFLISFFIFIYAPHHLNQGKTYKLPQKMNFPPKVQVPIQVVDPKPVESEEKEEL